MACLMDRVRPPPSNARLYIPRIYILGMQCQAWERVGSPERPGARSKESCPHLVRQLAGRTDWQSVLRAEEDTTAEGGANRRIRHWLLWQWGILALEHAHLFLRQLPGLTALDPAPAEGGPLLSLPLCRSEEHT